MTTTHHSPRNKTCIIIAGPTASGKTPLAIALAQHFNTSIISADSRQCFKELTIGVAKPSPQELQQVKHYFIGSHSIMDEVNAAVFEQYALAAAGEIFSRHDVAVMAGGTGLYIKAFCEGIDDIPAIPPELRASIADRYKREGLPWLQEAVRAEDPGWYASGEIHNPQRLARALEVIRATGRSIRSFQNGKAASRDFNIIKIGVELGRDQLYANINHRVDNMLKQRLLEAAVVTLIASLWFDSLGSGEWGLLFLLFGLLVSSPKWFPPAPFAVTTRVRFAEIACDVARYAGAGALLAWRLS